MTSTLERRTRSTSTSAAHLKVKPLANRSHAGTQLARLSGLRLPSGLELDVTCCGDQTSTVHGRESGIPFNSGVDRAMLVRDADRGSTLDLGKGAANLKERVSQKNAGSKERREGWGFKMALPPRLCACTRLSLSPGNRARVEEMHNERSGVP